MLKIEIGDVFNHLYTESEAGNPVIFVHGCNMQGVMGSGIAALVKKLYPFAFTIYKAGVKRASLGDIIVAKDVASNVVVVNALTQEFYGRDGKAYASYDAVVKTMESTAQYARATKLPVHLPLIGGGLGGLDKKRLIAIFEAVFHDVDATLWLKEE